MKKINRYYRVDYFSFKMNMYTFKIVQARNERQAYHKAKCNNIQGVQLIGFDREAYVPMVGRA